MDSVSGTARSGLRKRAPSAVWVAHGLLGVVLLGYCVSLVVRSADQRSPALDGWGVAGFELVVCALALRRAFTFRHGRAVSLVLGASMLSWSVGDVALTFESLGGASVPVPSVADVFYIGFYPLAFLGLVLLMRRSRPAPATWLDGVVAGLGAAAMCAAFAFHSIVHLAGDGTAAVATNLAYPVGDVLLLAMVAGGSAILAVGRKVSWLLVAAGCAINAVGDTFNLFHSAGSAHVGGVVDGIAWPTALLLMSAAVWVGGGRADPLAEPKAQGFVLPGLGAGGGLVVLLVGSTRGVDSVAVVLAAATLGVVGVRLFVSVSHLRALTERRHRQAVTDQLTGLGNRRRLATVLDAFFADEADPAVADRTLAFLYIDLDHFKEINDSFGHAAGDQLLAQIGPRIQRCLTGTDLLARIGGDELAVVLVDAGTERATLVAEQIGAAVREPFPLDFVSVCIGASIGIGIAPDHARTVADLMRCADQAMYRSKQTGSPYAVYDEVRDSNADRLMLVEELRTAIAERELELHYQPQVDLRTGAVTAVEALLRWSHPRLGPIPPLDFLPLAEEAGLMRPLTELVLDEALSQCRRWRADGRPVSISVNISATNVMDVGFSEMVRRSLTQHGLPPSALALEITETTIIADFDRCKTVVDELCTLGCVVSIDDFGAGFTSLPFLSRLSIDELKLDRTFLSQLAGQDSRDLELLRATIELAHALGLQVVAEGVEEQSTLDLLGRLGCDLAQGYHIGKPTPAWELGLGADLAA